MGTVVHTSKITITREQGPVRKAFIEGFADPVYYGIHGDIEGVNGVLKITEIRVHYTLKSRPEEEADARWAFENYLTKCPAAQSVIGCIRIAHELTLEPG